MARDLLPAKTQWENGKMRQIKRNFYLAGRQICRLLPAEAIGNSLAVCSRQSLADCWLCLASFKVKIQCNICQNSAVIWLIMWLQALLNGNISCTQQHLSEVNGTKQTQVNSCCPCVYTNAAYLPLFLSLCKTVSAVLRDIRRALFASDWG